MRQPWVYVVQMSKGLKDIAKEKSGLSNPQQAQGWLLIIKKLKSIFH